MFPNIAPATHALPTQARAPQARPESRRPVSSESAVDLGTARVGLDSAPPRLEKSPGPKLGYSPIAPRGSVNGRVGATPVEQTVDSELRFALAALPRDEEGQVDLESLANTSERSTLLNAVDRIAAEGLSEPGALATFIHAVDGLFAEYAQDLSMNPEALAEARQRFVDDVTGDLEKSSGEPRKVVAILSPSRVPIVLEAPDSALREKTMSRRRDLLTAAGDVSKVLAELTADTVERPEDSDARRRLGGFLLNLGSAVEKGSARALRAEARDRLTTPSDVEPSNVEPSNVEPPDAPSLDPVRVAQAFLLALAPA